MSKQIIFIGFLLIVVGGIFLIIEKSGFNYNNPLDFKFEKGNTKVFLPIGSSLLISIILSVVFYLIKKNVLNLNHRLFLHYVPGTRGN